MATTSGDQNANKNLKLDANTSIKCSNLVFEVASSNFFKRFRNSNTIQKNTIFQKERFSIFSKLKTKTGDKNDKKLQVFFNVCHFRKLNQTKKKHNHWK